MADAIASTFYGRDQCAVLAGRNFGQATDRSIGAEAHCKAGATFLSMSWPRIVRDRIKAGENLGKLILIDFFQATALLKCARKGRRVDRIEFYPACDKVRPSRY